VTFPEPTLLWESGSGGYATYRIPALVTCSDGIVLAFAEGRVHGAGDSGDIDLLMRKSTDGGHTWSPTRVLWDDGANVCGNPCPVVDQQTGKVHLFVTHNLGEDHESEIIAGTSKSTRTVWVLVSEDHGETWSEPKDWTASVKEPNWTWYATGPGAGIQMERGAHAGRLVIPCDHIEAETKRYLSHVVISDDGGASWKLGGTTPQDRVNECEVAEREDGSLLLNMRNYDRSVTARQTAKSFDGGATWVEQGHDPTLIEPVCQASLRRWFWESPTRRSSLLFTNPASASKRERMTVRLSLDDGHSWAQEHLLYEGSSAYSCLTVLSNGDALCLFEADGYKRMLLARIPRGWLPLQRPAHVFRMDGFERPSGSGGGPKKTPSRRE